MSERELEALEQRELSVKEEVSQGYTEFWKRRGVTWKLVSHRRKTPPWYGKRFGCAESYGAYPSDLEPEDLIQRALTRKKILDS